MIDFILYHPNTDEFHFCLEIIHRLLCFQKRCKVRIEFDWKLLWSALISQIKILQKKNIDYNAAIYLQIINIFNMFILYGDHFLSKIDYYDQLFYEIIREEEVFNKSCKLFLQIFLSIFSNVLNLNSVHFHFIASFTI